MQKSFQSTIGIKNKMKHSLPLLWIVIFLFLAACSVEALAADRLPWVGDAPVLFMDDFSHESGGWSHHSDSSSFSGYAEGGFRLWTSIPNYQFWSVPGLYFQDVLIQTKARKTSGPENNLFGVICRYQNPKNFYALVIGSDQYFGIFKMLDGEFELIGRPTMDFSQTIQTGDGLNEIQALCQDERLVLIVNGSKLIEVQDSSLSSGDVGLIAGNFDEPGISVLFDNFIVANP
jgi:hypothetical protein